MKSLEFSVNLLEHSKQHIFFLKRLHSLGITLNQPSPKSLQRYRDLWLPLVYQTNDIALLPPPDCAWLWHCHRLAPFRYTSYLKATFGKACPILEANPPFCFQQPDGTVCNAGEEQKALETISTQKLWEQRYPNEPFFLCHEEETNEEDLVLDGFDLVGSTDRQATFLWQVSGPRFSEDSFLQDGVSQYHKFLQLRTKTQGTRIVLVPTYQIDLMWHTHILAKVSGYYMDCKSIMGYTLNHDDSLNDRTEDGPLDRAFKETKDLWKKSYNEDYFIEGGMYRGEPPKEYYSTSWKASHLYNKELTPTGLFLHLIGVQGASSTNPAGGAYDLQVIWTWKETSSQMYKHDASKIVGDKADCWIKYDDFANQAIETAFKTQGGEGGYLLGKGYSIDFTSMKQIKKATGYQRDIQRHVDVMSTTTGPKIWCWKETQGQVSNHPASSIFGEPSNCWIKFDDAAIAKLEAAFQAQGPHGECSPLPGYTVNFDTMSQTKKSTGFQRDVQRVNPNEESKDVSRGGGSDSGWTPIDGTAPDGSPAFQSASAKSTTRGVNANSFIANYIFGKKGSNTGYFHITTKEAYEVMAARISVCTRQKETDIACTMCCTLGLCRNANWMKQAEVDLQDYKDIQQIASARAKANNPRGIVGLSPEIQNNQQTRRKHYSDGGDWFFPSTYYAAAGGCGAGSLPSGGSRGNGGSSGACGAAGCGAAACGAGGCGAAGCGGGGCGGGGCGGGGCGGGG